jgi:hypothetical protein
MAGWIWALIAVVVVVVCAAALWQFLSARKTKRLQERFGPEYERTALIAGGKREAEATLAAREERRETLNIRPLRAESRERYSTEWRQVQAEFVDSPADAVARADWLVNAVMSDRGYPMDEFDQRAADISVDHPQVVENYRAAHRIFVSRDDGDVDTEDQRQAMKHYRRLFDELLEGDGANGDDGSQSARASAGAKERTGARD